MEFNSNVKKVVLMVEVTNLPEAGREAEDAHQATLNVTFPPTLQYSGVRSQVWPPEGDHTTLYLTTLYFVKVINAD